MKRYTSLFALILITSLLAPAVVAQASGTWSPTGSMSTARSAITAMVLADGRVLVAGGVDASSNTLASAEIYDPAIGVWTLTGSMTTARNNYVAAMLTSGKVLVAGGCTNNNCSTATGTAELYDPATGTWSSTGSMSTIRYFFAGAVLKNGKVLVEGGCSKGDCMTNSATAELYSPTTGKWTLTGTMSSARDYHTATLLKNGKVLVAAGMTGGSIAEVYDPVTAKWTKTPSMTYATALHTATLLSNGKVLVAGGLIGYLPGSLSQVYDPIANKWSATASLITKRDNQSAVLLPSGKAMVVGGGSYSRPSYFKLASAELYDQVKGTWTATGSMSVERYQPGLVMLKSSQVLVVGGLSNFSALDSAEIYTP